MDAQLPAPHILHVYIRDFEFATRRRLEVLRYIHDRIVIDVEARYCVVTLGELGLFLDGESLVLAVKFHNAISLGIIDVIAEDGRAGFEISESSVETVASVKHVVPQNQRYSIFTDERFGNEKGLRDPFGLCLLPVVNVEPPGGAIPQQL